jgi:hypothetical protein
MPDAFIKLPTYINGLPANEGKVYRVSEADFNSLIINEKAESYNPTVHGKKNIENAPRTPEENDQRLEHKAVEDAARVADAAKVAAKVA